MAFPVRSTMAWGRNGWEANSAWHSVRSALGSKEDPSQPPLCWCLLQGAQVGMQKWPVQPALGRRTSWSYSLSPSVRERSSPPGPTLRYVALFVPVFRCSFNSPWLVFIDKHSSQRTDHYLRHLQQRLDYPDPLLFLTHLTCALRIHNRFFFFFGFSEIESCLQRCQQKNLLYIYLQSSALGSTAARRKEERMINYPT